jgi:hypothetical protein
MSKTLPNHRTTFDAGRAIRLNIGVIGPARVSAGRSTMAPA